MGMPLSGGCVKKSAGIPLVEPSLSGHPGLRATLAGMDDPAVAADLAETADEYAQIEADEAAEDDDQGEDDAPAVVYVKRRAVRGSLPPR